jgi:hypothetical protein
LHALLALLAERRTAREPLIFVNIINGDCNRVAAPSKDGGSQLRELDRQFFEISGCGKPETFTFNIGMDSLIKSLSEFCVPLLPDTQ